VTEAALKSYMVTAAWAAWASAPLSRHSAKLADLRINLRSGCIADMWNPAERVVFSRGRAPA